MTIPSFATLTVDAIVREFNGHYEGFVLLDKPLSDEEVQMIPGLYEGDRDLEKKYGLEGICVFRQGLITFDVQATGYDRPWEDLSLFVEKVLNITGAGIASCKVQGHLLRKPE